MAQRTPEDVVHHIVKLARKGLTVTPSQIGVTLRDSHGIPRVRFVTGNKILRTLKSQGVPFLRFFPLHPLILVSSSPFLLRAHLAHTLAPHQEGGCRP